MLKQRLITAFILGPLVVWGILASSTHWFGIIFSIFVVVGAWEWSRLIRIENIAGRIAYTVFITSLLWVASSWGMTNQTILYITGAGVLWWIVASVMVFRYRGETEFKPGLFDMLAGVLLLLPCWAGFTWLHGHEQGPQLVLFTMLSIWAADSGAYFAGRRFGKRKLAPFASPGKSWEGVFGGFIFAALFAVVSALFWFEWTGSYAVAFIFLAVITVIISVVGDLAESVFKRRVGVKDSGNILPGHGGVLDRIDSLTAASPVFATGFWFMENFL